MHAHGCGHRALGSTWPCTWPCTWTRTWGSTCALCSSHSQDLRARPDPLRAQEAEASSLWLSRVLPQLCTLRAPYPTHSIRLRVCRTNCAAVTAHHTTRCIPDALNRRCELALCRQLLSFGGVHSCCRCSLAMSLRWHSTSATSRCRVHARACAASGEVNRASGRMPLVRTASVNAQHCHAGCR